jgi:protein-ribulosamine 3-kinase
MTPEFKSYIEGVIGQKIGSLRALGGGDISSVLLVLTENHNFVLKYGQQSDQMFTSEKLGLEAIRDSNTISTPKIYLIDSFGDIDFLIMEYIESTAGNPESMETFGRSLADLHLQTAHGDLYGFLSDNFIGRLPQINQWTDSWPDFYSRFRLFYQIQMAQENGLLQSREVPSITRIDEACHTFLHVERPALLHGDLWSGNYIISKIGAPYLIDPAVYYGDPMVDIAMSRLFGGFGQDFYSAYFEKIERPSNFDQRIDLYQLYYLLVHLNMFGTSYYSSVSRLVRKYF